MSMKFIRFVAALTVIVSVIGNTGVVLADRDAQSVFEDQALNNRALSVPSASSLGVQFVHVATTANTSADSTDLDHPLLNGNPNAIIIVTPNYSPGNVAGAVNNHPIGVFFASGRWKIFNQDAVAIPIGTVFNVLIPTTGTNVFVHTAIASNISGNSTYIDNALTNNNPNAIILVTPNWNPGSVGGTEDNHPIGVNYTSGKWRIFNQDGVTMPTNAAFNVLVLTAGTGVFVHTATAGNSSGNSTYINNTLTNSNPNAIVFTTPNYNPGGVGGTGNNHNISVWYNSAVSEWAIFNQDGVTPAANAAFNVLVLVPNSATFVHKATASNSSNDHTNIDSALTNSHPNAIVFTTPNYNPGGIGGIYDNHNIGVYYDGSANQWGIFNQDNVTMPGNAAFNVLVPHPDTRVFVHKATVANSTGDTTMIDYPLTNGKPNAIVFVTPNWNPGNVGGTYDNRPIGVFYDSVTSKWDFDEDTSTMPINASFNVFVPTASTGTSVVVHTATAGNTITNSTLIDNSLSNGNRNAIIIVTPNYNPGGVGGTYNNHPISVYYDGSKWRILNQDLAAITSDTAFNVYIFVNYINYVPLVIR